MRQYMHLLLCIHLFLALWDNPLLHLCVTQHDRWWLDQKVIYIVYVCTGSICSLFSFAGVILGGQRIMMAFRSGKRW